MAPSLASLELHCLGLRGTDPRVAQLAAPRLTRLTFARCGPEAVAAWDGVALSAVRLARLEVGPGAVPLV